MGKKDKKIKIAVVGVGNCVSALIQGIEYYRNSKPNDTVGLISYQINGYKVSDIEVVAAFDIDERKVNKDLSEAIFAKPNCTKVFYHKIPKLNVKVKMGPVLDGVAKHMENWPKDRAFIVAKETPVDVVKELKESGAEILLNYLPVGSEEATRFYAEACLEAKVAFINNIPVFIASSKEWAKRFEKENIPLVGDDIKSQLGATILHRTLVRLFTQRGIKIDRTYQLNIGGNTDFLNMLARERLSSKKISKTEAVQSQLDIPIEEDNIHIGPSDYVPWQLDNKVCFIRIEGRGFGNMNVELDVRLSVEDSPNSAGIGIDAIRCCKVALDRGIGGVLTSISAWAMKHPMVQLSDVEAEKRVKEFILGKRER